MMSDPNVIRRIDRSAFASMFIYAASANVLPICLVKISEELSINLTQAGLLGFVSSMEQFVILILSVFGAARFGKIRMIRTAMVILASGLAAFSLSRSYTMAICLILLVGFGSAILEALLTPLVEDLHPGDSGSRMNLLHAFWPIGVCTGVLVFGEMLSRGMSWRLTFAGLSAAVALIAVSYPGSKKAALPPSRADLGHLGEILRIPGFWFFGFALFFAGAAEFAFAYWSASYIQINFNTLPRAGAFGAAAFAVGMITGRMITSRLARRTGLRNIIIFSAFIGFAFSLTFFLINEPLLIYIYLFIMGLFIACFWPSIQSYAARVMIVDPTALMVFLSCFGIPGTSVSILLMGIIGDHYGLRAAYAAAPVFMLMVAVLILLGPKLPGVSRNKAAAQQP